MDFILYKKKPNLLHVTTETTNMGDIPVFLVYDKLSDK